jgi:homoserine O-succinyltransferase
VSRQRPAARDPARGRRRIVVGLVNNMSDGALRATEEQFCSLLAEAAAPSDLDVSVRFYSLPQVQRGDEARTHMAGRYAPAEALERDGLDALVVTGAEPRAATFDEEAYWPSLARLIDWAEAEQVPTVWSCLAAHAALWRLHGVPRRRFDVKLSGVFGLRPATGHPLLADAPTALSTPHSRWNDLDSSDITAAGYEILAHSPAAGVDTFLRAGRATSIFFQGHPEYDAGALGREYVRDVSRFLRGQQPAPPHPPDGYFDAPTQDVLGVLTDRMLRAPDPERLADCQHAVDRRPPSAPWRPWAVHAYRIWLRQFEDRSSVGRARRASVAG